MRGVRLLGAVALACASVPFGGVGTAHAETASLVPSNAAYFYALGVDKPEQSPAAPPNVTGSADGVSAGHLGVAAQGGQEDKVSFLYFDMFSLPAGITVTKAVVSMKTVDSPPQDVSVQAAPELVAACKAGDGGFSGDDGANLDNSAPERLCSAFAAKGTAGAPGSYQWDITALAQSWVDGSNDGVAFTRDPATPNSSFQVVFDEASTARLQLDYTLPVAEPPVVTPPVTPDVPLAPEPGVVGPPPTVITDPGTPVVPNPTVNVPPAPVTSGPTQVAAQPVALETSLRPNNQLWLAGLGLAATLLLLSLVLGDPNVSAASRRTSRLSLALAGNKRLLTPAPVMRPRHL